MIGYGEKRSKYYYKDCDVLINKMDIKDKKLLDEYERRIVSIKLLVINYASFSNKFDAKMLREIHEFLFSEVYDFAGEYREENVAKDEFRFANYEFIESEVDRILKPFSNLDEFRNLDKKKAATNFAYIISELNVIHPFREGNGRAYREFVRQFAKEVGYTLDWSKCAYEDILNASIRSIYDSTELIEVIGKCIRKTRVKKDEKEIKK